MSISSRTSPIHAPGAAVEGPRPSGAGSPIHYAFAKALLDQDAEPRWTIHGDTMQASGPWLRYEAKVEVVPVAPRREAERTCACGCGRSLEGRRVGTLYALTACRMRAARKRNVSVTNPIAEPKTPKRSSGPSGLQISYAKAVRMLITDYRELNLPDAEVRAAALARRMLSDAQRARLDGRRTG